MVIRDFIIYLIRLQLEPQISYESFWLIEPNANVRGSYKEMRYRFTGYPWQSSPSFETAMREVRLILSLGSRVSWKDLNWNIHSVRMFVFTGVFSTINHLTPWAHRY